jgi:hypothetical protein
MARSEATLDAATYLEPPLITPFGFKNNKEII